MGIERAADRIGPGMYREAVAQGRVPAWIAANLASIELIEAKIYNTHRLGGNLPLALTFPAPIDPSPGRGPAARELLASGIPVPPPREE